MYGTELRESLAAAAAATAASFLRMFKASLVIQHGCIGPHYAPGIVLGERNTDTKKIP